MHTHRSLRGFALASFAWLTIVGCLTATPTPGTGSNAMPRLDVPSPSALDGTVLTAENLASTHASSTTEAIRLLRPEFLRGAGGAPRAGAPEIAIYIDDLYAGDVSILNAILLQTVRRVMLLPSSEARLRFGPLCRCTNGAIIVAIREPGQS
jgi:hypothetical protein